MMLRLDGAGPRYGQIARALVAGIRDGVVKPGHRAPSTRQLAEDTGCSRNVVLLAYEQLRLEGYFVSRSRSGTFVAPDLSNWMQAPAGESFGTQPAGRGRPSAYRRRTLLPPVGRRLTQAAAEAMAVIRHRPFVAIDFMYGLSQPDERLLRELRRALGRSLRDRAFFYGPLGGNAALRQQIAGRLRGARGISRSADHIVLTSGTQQALDICARILLTAGDRVVTEDPGYEVAAAAFGAAGARIRYVPVDRDGLNPGILPVGRSHRLIYVTPSHQFPTGAVMPIARRYALVEWARRTGAFIFEDDYDGEFRYAGQPIPALASIDPETVIYCGTFAKSLFPSCRLGYLVLPTALVAPAAQCKWLTDRGSSVLVERALGDLLATGDYDRHIRRMQRRYRDRRAALIHSLHAHLGRAAKVEGHSAGLHLVAALPALPAERISAIVEVCRHRGVGVYPLASHAKRAHVGAALILGYGLLPVEQIDPGIRVLGEVYRHEMSRLKRTAAERQSGLTALTRKRT